MIQLTSEVALIPSVKETDAYDTMRSKLERVTMRFLHHNTAELSRHIVASSWHVWRVNDDTVEQIDTATSEVETMLRQSELLWGSSLSHYLLVTGERPPRIQQLKFAVAEVESGASEVHFLLIAYQDGGIISVSKKAYPFQSTAQAAEWWRPPRSSKLNLHRPVRNLLRR